MQAFVDLRLILFIWIWIPFFECKGSIQYNMVFIYFDAKSYITLNLPDATNNNLSAVLRNINKFLWSQLKSRIYKPWW